MPNVAVGAAATSATAAVISALFAGGSSVAAWLTIRGRRPKLRVVGVVGNAAKGGLIKDPEGEYIGVRAANIRELEVQAVDLWFEAATPRVVLRWPPLSRPDAAVVWPDLAWFIGPPADVVPGTIRPHHTAMYTFRMRDLGAALADAGHGVYRVVIECTDGRQFRSEPLAVSASPAAAEQSRASTETEA